MQWVIFHSTNERSHWTKHNISNPNLNNSILLKNSNLNNSILLKSVSYCYCYCSEANRIFRSESRALLECSTSTWVFPYTVTSNFSIETPSGNVTNQKVKRITCKLCNSNDRCCQSVTSACRVRAAIQFTSKGRETFLD